MKWVLPVLLLACSLPLRAVAGAEPQIVDASVPSPMLASFLGRPAGIGATALLPDSYYRDPGRRYPVIYVIPPFDGDDGIDPETELAWQRPMRALHREFIVVFLQAMVEIGGESVHEEFANSANLGPWGSALTTEFVPATDARFRTLAQPRYRALFGHSSGAWSALWLQVNYPESFGGAWALAPDPVDFHDFIGTDLTRDPPPNLYEDAAGRTYGFQRIRGVDTSTIRQLEQTDETTQRQFDSFDAVFGPRQPGGSPQPLFDRESGAIDPNVARYWEAHYDITHILVQRWPKLGPHLAGKLHVFVGTADTFHLEGSVRLMRDALAKLGSDAQIEFVPGADHWQIYAWHGGLIRYAMSQMNYP